MSPRAPHRRLSRSEAGKLRQATGDRLERSVEAVAALYRRSTWANAQGSAYRLRRAGEPSVALLTRPRPKTVGPQGRMRVAEKSSVDFVGQLAFGPQSPLFPVAFDCKSVTGAASFGVDPEERHQLDYLADVQAMGGIGFYLLEDGRENRCWILTDLAPLLAGHRVKFRRLATPTGALTPKTACDLLPYAVHGPLPGLAALGYDVIGLLRQALITAPSAIDDSALTPPPIARERTA